MKITIGDLYTAYRKVKADLFFERSISNAEKFVQYEGKLEKNLERLLETLNNERLATGRSWYLDLSFIGSVTFIPKSLELPKEDEFAPKFFVSNVEDSWKNVFQNISGDGAKKLKAEFRHMADFTIDMHVVCALWINKIGARLDSCLGQCAMGARLRRIGDKKDYHENAWQSFQPYIRSYKKWRENGFKVIRNEIDEGRKVVAITMDFRRFFHQIDAGFLVDKEFLELVKIKSEGRVELSESELSFTSKIVEAFKVWNLSVPGINVNRPIGLPVGATASRVIANVFLLGFDQAILRNLSPLYYARYVDDLFLVIKDTGDFRDGTEF